MGLLHFIQCDFFYIYIWFLTWVWVCVCVCRWLLQCVVVVVVVCFSSREEKRQKKNQSGKNKFQGGLETEAAANTSRTPLGRGLAVGDSTWRLWFSAEVRISDWIVEEWMKSVFSVLAHGKSHYFGLLGASYALWDRRAPSQWRSLTLHAEVFLRTTTDTDRIPRHDCMHCAARTKPKTLKRRCPSSNFVAVCVCIVFVSYVMADDEGDKPTIPKPRKKLDKKQTTYTRYTIHQHHTHKRRCRKILHEGKYASSATCVVSFTHITTNGIYIYSCLYLAYRFWVFNF